MFLALWYHNVLGVAFAVIALLLIIVILLQRGKGVGLAGAFGGAGGGAAFGAKTGDLLTWVTIVAAVLMLTFTVVLNFVFRPIGPGLQQSTPAAPAAPQPGSPEGSTSTGTEGAWHITVPADAVAHAGNRIFGEQEA
jgi:preprotein translocase subunit SecG